MVASPGRPAGDGGRGSRPAGHDRVGGPRGRLRGLPRRPARPGASSGACAANRLVQALRAAPDPDRCRPRLRRRLPDHGARHTAGSWRAPAFALVGFAVGVGSVVAISLRQRLTPAEVMGRVGAASRGIVWGAAPVGALVAGSLAALAGLRLPLVLAGVLQCVGGSCSWPAPSSAASGRSASPACSRTGSDAHFELSHSTTTAVRAAKRRSSGVAVPAIRGPASRRHGRIRKLQARCNLKS